MEFWGFFWRIFNYEFNIFSRYMTIQVIYFLTEFYQCVSFKIWSFSSKFLIYMQQITHSISLLFFLMSVELVVISHLLYLILVICIFSLFLLVTLARSLLILLIFLLEPASGFIDFSLLFSLFSILLIYFFIFILLFLFLALSLAGYSFSSFF